MGNLSERERNSSEQTLCLSSEQTSFFLRRKARQPWRTLHLASKAQCGITDWYTVSFDDGAVVLWNRQTGALRGVVAGSGRKGAHLAPRSAGR